MHNVSANEFLAKNNEIIQTKSLKFFICALAKAFRVPSNCFFFLILLLSLIFGEKWSNYPIYMYFIF